MKDSEFYTNLSSSLDAKAVSAERFNIKDENVEFDLLLFENRPFRGTKSIITNGLSKLKAGKGDEIIFSFDPTTVNPSEDVDAFLATYIQLHYLKHKDEIGIGSYFNVGRPILDGYNFIGMYTTAPVYFPEDFVEENRLVNFLWIIPIFESEYSFLVQNGSDQFESLLVELDPDLTKFDRRPVV